MSPRSSRKRSLSKRSPVCSSHRRQVSGLISSDMMISPLSDARPNSIFASTSSIPALWKSSESSLPARLAMENNDTPTALILSRQDIAPVPNVNLEGFRKGAYIVSKDENPQVVLLASGSEVSTLLAGAELLRAEGIRLQIVSVPSEGLFREQLKEYQDYVLPKGIKRFGMTAGLPCTLESLVGENGAIWGLNSFGFSAPYKVLDEKLGFTAQNVYEQVKKLL